MDKSVFSVKKVLNSVASVILAMAVLFTFMPFVDGQTFAAVKKPGKINKLEAKCVNNKITITWNKSTGAKKYVVQRGKAGKVWKYVKKVKKTKANRKKYTSSKYKVKASGKKYKVYKRVNGTVYKKVATVKKCRYKVTGDYETEYIYRVYAVNGSKKGTAAVVEFSTPEEPEVVETKEAVEKFVEHTKYQVSIVYSFNGKTAFTFESAATVKSGMKATLKTKSTKDYKFIRWEAMEPGTIEFDDANAESTSFVMPEQKVRIKAVFEKVE